MDRITRSTLLAAVLASTLLAACKRPADLPDGAVSRTQVDFAVPAAGGEPAVETVSIANGGHGTLEVPTVTVTYQEGDGWLTALVSGSSAPYVLALQPATAGLAAGTYHAIVTIAWGSGGASPVQVSVTLVVPTRAPEAPRLGLSRAAVAIQAPAAGNPGAELVYARNDGGGALPAPTAEIAYQDGAGWLTAQVSGSGAPYTVALQATSAALAAGSYRATVTLACAGASGSPAQVGVALVVPGPGYRASVPSLAIEAPRGGADPAAVSFDVLNAGRGAIPVPQIDVAYAGTATGWLTAAVSGTSGAYGVAVQAHVAGVPSGVHQATLTVRAASPGIDAVVIPVTLTVPPPEVVLASHELTVRAPAGGLAASASAAVTNGGGGRLAAPVAAVTYDAGSAASWDGLLAVTVTGTQAPFRLDLVAHQVTSSGARLAPGTYVATVVVTSPGAAVSDRVRVTLEVPRPVMRLSTPGVAFSQFTTCPLPSPASASVVNDGGGALARPEVVLAAGAEAWLGVSVAASGPDAYAVTVSPTAFPPTDASGVAVTTASLVDPSGLASPVSLQVRFDALASELASATVTPARLDVWAQVGMGDPAPRTFTLRTPGGCFRDPAVEVALTSGTDATWLTSVAIVSSGHQHDVTVVTSVAGLAAGEQRAATLHVGLGGKTWNVPVTLGAGAFKGAGPLPVGTSSTILTPLADGGAVLTGHDGLYDSGAGAMRFDAATETWTLLPTPREDRRWHGAVQLDDGRVLLCGGYRADGRQSATCEALVGNRWELVGTLTTARADVTLVTMPRGRVLVVSKPLTQSPPLAEVLDLATGRSTVLTGVTGTAAVKRPDGSILVAGGTVAGNVSNSMPTWLYSPELDRWEPAGDMWKETFPLDRPALLPLPDGRVLAVGDTSGLFLEINNANLWDPRTKTWSRAAPSPTTHTTLSRITSLSSGKVLAWGGITKSKGSTDLEVYDPATNQWSVVGTGSPAFLATGGVRLSSGKVLFAGGGIWDPNTSRLVKTLETFTW